MEELETQFPPKMFPAALARYALVFDIDEDWEHGIEVYRKSGREKDKPVSQIAFPLIDKLRSADMIVQEFFGKDKKEYYALISISEKRQRLVAELMGLRLRVKRADDETNPVKRDGAWAAFKQHLKPVFERCSEGTIFSSSDQCQMIEFLLNDVDVRAMGPQLIQQESCEPGNTPLKQLKKDGRIRDYFYMHHPEKFEWLKNNWVDTFTKRQPIEDLREYFGESIALYFSWMGFLLTMLWVPALTGVVVFIVGLIAFATGGTFDNPYVPLYCVFMSIWSIIASSEWKKLEKTWQYQWGTVEYSEPEKDRTEFVQNSKTYKRLNELLEKEEFYPDPFWRYMSLLLTSVVLPLMVALNIALYISVDLFEKGVSKSAGGKLGPIAYFCAVVHAGIFLGVGYVFEKLVLERLTAFENWRTETEYKDSKVAKYAFYFQTAAYFPVFFWGFVWNVAHVGDLDMACDDNICYDYMMLKIPTFFFAILFGRYLIHVIEGSIRSARAAATDDAAKPEEKKDAGAGAGGGGKEAGDGGAGGVDRPAEDDEVERQRPKHFEEDLLKPTLEPGDVVDWYLPKLVDLGFVVLFSGAFPLLPLVLLVVQIVEIRRKARLVLDEVQRPRPRRAKDLGTINDFFDILVTAGILTQCCVLAFGSNGLTYYFPKLTMAQRILYAAVLEHLLLLFKIVWDANMGELPDEVAKAFERRENEKEGILLEVDHFDPQHEVVFYTSDDGEAFYTKKKGEK